MTQMILVYSVQDGAATLPMHTIEAPWPEGTIEAIEAAGTPYVVTDLADLSTVYVDLSGENAVVRPRPAPCWTATTESVQVGGEFLISGLPQGATVTIGQQTFTTPDGDFEFVSEQAAVYPYRVEAWPYWPTEGAMVFQ